MKKKKIAPISDRAFVTNMLDMGSIPCLAFSNKKGQCKQRWSRGHKARGQGQGHKKIPRPRPRTAFSRTDPLEAKDSNARGLGQGPRTQAQAFSK